VVPFPGVEADFSERTGKKGHASLDHTSHDLGEGRIVRSHDQGRFDPSGAFVGEGLDE
jgi:hypothetical protein